MIEIEMLDRRVNPHVSLEYLRDLAARLRHEGKASDAADLEALVNRRSAKEKERA